MRNRENFLFYGDANLTKKIIVPAHATRADIMKDGEGYWLNVWWRCGIIAPLTHNELIQALGEEKCYPLKHSRN